MLMRSEPGCGCLLKPVGTVDVKCETPVVCLLIARLPPYIPPSHRGTRRQKQSVYTRVECGKRQLILTELD